ncbi:MAG: inositol 2-dehydrogenase [Bacteroidetes bacterium]|nr:inositol 2-dehydrogenase [Bacteroidota bacterium]MBU1116949.1 inositol 2-dehydrogenase [Bacteroidota bacterium]MBU1799122.1 inositol 2-dehydrogenase [Bacteroidota bacterium]
MEKLKIGIIGAGRIGKVHTETIIQNVPEAEVVYIADVNLDEAKNLAERFRIKNYSNNHKDIIDDTEINAVIICSPTNTHAQYIVEAAKAKKHIFCEKPIDLDLEIIENAIKVVEENNVKLMVGFNRRFDSNFKKIKQMVFEGKIGEPHILKITSRDPAPPSPEYSAVSGGMFLDMTIHDFDMARYIVGSEIEEVYAIAGVMIDEKIGEAGDVDTALITLKFVNGAMGVIDNSRKAVYGYDQRVEIFGSKGMLKVDNNAPDNHKYYSEIGVHASLPLNFFMDRYIEAYASEIDEFCQAIINDKPISVGGIDGLLAVAIGKAAKLSVNEKRPVKIAEIWNK